jgi:hypothetical protein
MPPQDGVTSGSPRKYQTPSPREDCPDGASITLRSSATISIAWQCTNVPLCTWTTYHTPAYHIDDAENLLLRLRAYEEHEPLLPELLAAPLRPAIPAAELPLGPIPCRNEHCKTQAGLRTKGSRLCIELLCKTCCTAAQRDAVANKKERMSCKPHKQAAVIPVAAGMLSQPRSASVQVAAPSHPPARNIDHLIDPRLLAISQTPTTAPLLVPGSSVQPPLIVSEPQPIPRQDVVAPLRRSLAQPLGPLWRQQHHQAQADRLEIQSLKRQNEVMKEMERRTVHFTIYYAVRFDILRCSHVYLFLIYRTASSLSILSNTFQHIHKLSSRRSRSL